MAQAEQKAAEEKAAFHEQVAAERARKAELVPLPLGELCRIIGPDVDIGEFASTALMSLAIQLEGLRSIAAKDDGGSSYDQWCVITNIVDRMRLASRVGRWLETGKPQVLPEVQP